MTRRRHTAVTALLLAIAAATTGCSTGGNAVEDPVTVEDAKAATQQFETEVAATINDEIVDRTEQDETGVLLPCNEENTYQWTGNTRVFLTGPTDEEAMLQQVAERFESGTYSTDSGRPETIIFGPGGEAAVVSYREKAVAINIASGSACFRLPDDADPTAEY